MKRALPFLLLCFLCAQLGPAKADAASDRRWIERSAVCRGLLEADLDTGRETEETARSILHTITTFTAYVVGAEDQKMISASDAESLRKQGREILEKPNTTDDPNAIMQKCINNIAPKIEAALLGAQ